MKPGLCLESGEFVPADELNALPIDVSVPDQPSPFDVPTMSHVAHRKLAALVAEGHEICGVMIQRQNADGTVTRGAVSAGGMVIWWQPERAQIGQGEPTDEQIMATVQQKGFGFSQSRPLAQQWDQVCELIRAVVRERNTHPAPQQKPLLQRIAHLEATASANYGRGHADAHSMLSERIAELERQLEEALKDAEPIRRMKQRADELIAAFESAPDGKALDMQKGQS